MTDPEEQDSECRMARLPLAGFCPTVSGAAVSGPVRIQLSRRKGWRMPENTVSVARPGRWGNPFVGDRAAAVEAFRQWWSGAVSVSVGPDQPIKRMAFIPAYEKPPLEPLRGKNLACWCPLDQPCHADVLLELANKETDQ